jgi:hypothetical protein
VDRGLRARAGAHPRAGALFCCIRRLVATREPDGAGAQWGGETAAALLHRYLVPEAAIIYTDEIPPRLLSEYRLKADTSGRVVLRRRFWNSVPAPRADVVPPLLIYADLLTAGDARSIDAANRSMMPTVFDLSHIEELALSRLPSAFSRRS